MKATFCNLCGKTFDDTDTFQEAHFQHLVGYGSKYDEERMDIDLCCDCFDRLMDRLIPLCRIPPFMSQQQKLGVPYILFTQENNGQEGKHYAQEE